MKYAVLLFVSFILALISWSCRNASPRNPSLPLTKSNARMFIKEMRKHPIPLQRPLIVLGGFYDFGVPAAFLKRYFLGIFRHRRILAVSFMGCHTFDSCVKRLISAVESKFPSNHAARTIEADVVAVSMGGLVARYAALPHNCHKQFHIHRLFTISTPHQGATLAKFPAWGALQLDMRSGSFFLKRLTNTPTEYPIFPYVRLGDWLVGPQNAAPAGENPWWVPHRKIMAHTLSFCDDRILADILARLRGERPFSTFPRKLIPRTAA